MSRFGDTATFVYRDGDVLTAGTTVVLNSSQMPQYPFEAQFISDRVQYRSKSGKAWSYQNYNLQGYVFRWSLLDEAMRGTLKAMFESNPILTFNSNGTNWGTYRIAESSWQDSEVLNELFDLEFTIEETR